MRRFWDGLLKEALLRVSREHGRLEVTAKGPIAVVGILLLAIAIVVIFGNEIVALFK